MTLEQSMVFSDRKGLFKKNEFLTQNYIEGFFYNCFLLLVIYQI